MRVPTLALVGHVTTTETGPKGFHQVTWRYREQVDSGKTCISVDVPMYDYGDNVVAAPRVALAGSILSLDLGYWEPYDFTAQRSFGGLVFTTTEPGAAAFVAVVRRYVQEARKLNPAELQAWAAKIRKEDA